MTEQYPTVAALLNSLNEGAAERKSLTDKFPVCEWLQYLNGRSKRTVNRISKSQVIEPLKDTNFSRENRIPKKHWRTLTGLAAKCDFRDQTAIHGTEGQPTRGIQVRSGIRKKNTSAKNIQRRSERKTNQCAQSASKEIHVLDADWYSRRITGPHVKSRTKDAEIVQQLAISTNVR